MIGQTISHYTMLEKLGEGGMGIVYKAHDMKLDRDVAIKFLPRHVTASAVDRERFVIEAQAAAALNHPHIATVYSIEEVDDETFFVMEYIDGQELKQRVRSAPLSVDEAVEIARQIAEGLQAAHKRGIVHRDIKSSNIMLTADSNVKIMDFGLAKVRGSSQITKAGSTLGTVAYMSPEQARGEEVDHRSDIWSFGIVLYEILSGQMPFATEYEHAIIYSILNETPKPISAVRTDIPEALAKVLNRALTKDLNPRYQSTDEILADLKAIKAGNSSVLKQAASFGDRIRRPAFWIPALILLAGLSSAFVWWFNHQENVRWAREEALPEIERLVQDGTGSEGLSAWTAFELASKVEAYIPDDPLFARLLPRYSRKVLFFSNPEGAKVFAKPYSQPASEWRYIGQTPIDSIRFPLGFSRVKLEKSGYRTAYDLIWNSGNFGDTLLYQLSVADDLPATMEAIPAYASWYQIIAAPAALHMPGLENIEPVNVGSFLMDRFEVTNKEFKRFVEGGGYRTQEFWKYSVVKDNRQLVWEEAMKLFIDKTGQHGPSTWEVGDYPAGKDDYPVTGVSWYEAAAYAEFTGKSLPTIYHWDRVAFTWASPVIVPMSNLRGDGPKPVGSSQSMNRFGISDLGGNAREWCLNETNRGGRFILGGGWNDPAYAFNDAYAQSPLDRTETNGFRCITYAGGAPNANLEQPVVLPFRDFLREPKVSDETFALYVNQYSYDKTPLNAKVEAMKEEADWVKEKITFDAAYASERMMAYLFLPKKGKPPYQTIVYFPGSGAIHTRSSETLETGRIDFLLKSGRAVLYPIYKSTYERGDDLHSDYPTETNFWKDHVIMWAKDCSRSIDYLETRAEIDRNKIAYYGASWGGAMGGIIPAVEKRIRLNILLVAGLLVQRSLPEAEPVHFLPRITSPVLMLNGKYDFFFPYETSQRPFFELLGTGKDDKKILAYEGGHSVPRTQLVKESLAWLDRYFGTTE